MSYASWVPLECTAQPDSEADRRSTHPDTVQAGEVSENDPNLVHSENRLVKFFIYIEDKNTGHPNSGIFGILKTGLLKVLFL